MHQAKDRTNRVKPRNNPHVDAQNRPQSLCVGKRVRNFTESCCRRGKCEKVKCMKQVHVFNAAVGGASGDQCHAGYADCVNDDQRKNWPAHVAQDYHGYAIKIGYGSHVCLSARYQRVADDYDDGDEAGNQRTACHRDDVGHSFGAWTDRRLFLCDHPDHARRDQQHVDDKAACE